MDAPTISATAQLITALAAFVAALASIYAALTSLRNAKGIEKVHVATNSMKDALVKAVGEQEHAKGVIEGVAKEKAGDAK